MKLKSRQYAIALYQSLKECPPDKQNELIASFVKILQKNKQLKLMNKIILEYSNYTKERSGIVNVHATVASAVNIDDFKKELVSQLGKDIDLQVQIDPTIMAGLILQIGDTLIDGSVNNQLNILKNKLINS
ncbi:MAG: F0F1 ATP synthase subunit delta [Patescibacteria group bacterium]